MDYFGSHVFSVHVYDNSAAKRAALLCFAHTGKSKGVSKKTQIDLYSFLQTISFNETHN